MTDPLIRVLGWRAMFIQGDPMVYDRLRWLRRHLRPGPLRTLDAGCGNGAFTLYAASIGNDAVGISFDAANNRKAIARAALLGLSGARFIQGDLRQLDSMRTELGAFDQVICLETIEHIMDDHKLARDLAAMLKPGGRLFLSAPYTGCPPMRGDKISAIENGDHVRWGYTHDEMRAILADAGFDKVAEEYCSGIVSRKIGNLERTIAQITPVLGWAATFPLRAFQIMDRAATDTLGAPYLSIAVVAEKRA
ncbi:MAG TPA: methyltransferase domain-containing protein [Candidatus Binataceae bacterium]|nr:methyltransferase domain-containing protein [Candidatus Binataceae bacterium]